MLVVEEGRGGRRDEELAAVAVGASVLVVCGQWLATFWRRGECASGAWFVFYGWMGGGGGGGGEVCDVRP